jgi:hypothetical protein
VYNSLVEAPMLVVLLELLIVSLLTIISSKYYYIINISNIISALFRGPISY